MESRRRVVLLLLLASLTGGFVTGRDLFFSLAYLWAGLLIVGLAWTWTSVRGLRLSRQTRARRAQVGRLLDERLAIHNTSRLPKLWVEVRDDSTLPEHRASRVVDSLGAHSERAWNVRTTCLERGRFRLGPLTVAAGDPFGLFQTTRRLPQTTSVVIYPHTVDLPDFELPQDLWRRSPEFKLPDSSEEYAVSAAASVAQYFIRRDRAVGLAFYGQTREALQADRGERQLTRILETLAVARALGQITLEEMLAIEADQLARGTTAILVTPDAGRTTVIAAQTLQRRGLRVVAVLVDAPGFSGTLAGLPPAAAVAPLLEASHIPTRILRCGDDLAAALAGRSRGAAKYR
ncbi:MAG: hypothetical protein HY784_12525 [Chloroflexi bacterium]|nr:hypothetical protein [Chloroflexota bacterium]